MKSIIIMYLFTLALSAQNPKVYAALGDVIYNNIDKITTLKTIEEYKEYITTIDAYTQDVKEAKKNGFCIEAGKKCMDKKEYLNILRKLSQTNDYFVRSVKKNFSKAMKEKNNLLFSKIINSSLLNTKKRKAIIINYYYENMDDINASGVIQTFLDKDAKLKRLKDAQRKKYKTKKMLEKEKINRIRENDKRKQEELEKKLQDEVQRKKIEIRKEQQKSLFH